MLYREQGRRAGHSYYHVGDGFHYKIERVSANDNCAYFTCKSTLCSGRALFRADGYFEHTQPHNHAPDLLYNEVQAARRQILDRTRTVTYASFADILATERSRIRSRLIRSQLTLRRLRPAMLRVRREAFPNLPRNLAGLTTTLQDPAWDWLTKTKDSQDRMYLGSTWAADGSHNVIFISRRCLQIMRMVSIIFADGTFYISPSVEGCYQVFTIVTISENTVIPLCWCLMERKTEHAYIAVLMIIRQHLGNWRFNRVITDFEDAMINAFRAVFQVEVQGCYFHSANAMGQHARVTIGVQLLHIFPDISCVVRLCCSLPLLPQHLIQRGFNLIAVTAMENINAFLFICIVVPYLEYIQHDWLHHANRGQTLSVCGSEHRTNNASESNNRRMKRSFGVHHPNIYHFIRKLADFEDAAVDDIFSLGGGNLPNRHRDVRSISNDAHIAAITRELLQTNNPSDVQILRFLTMASVTVADLLDVLLEQ
ncbi:UDP-N-acetylglucosamine--N-acetylmuramyl-(pentapeptide) pyrophosphoryl-undecaprenol N-acetylglucosamine transferase 1 [Frankliniella fusca]|uniref:UDP-N-acetylglucosamine--N-acetylmuramyl-(Pentapeptide) pyrophosphoryl-undecaprenol N-acetylglucosamine transferase 1 n=1 Tax=Frankliniella fusca TaxID=407009 RepID=A0AAE1HI33_9NEOP|nr:UDP-N-acetylglucosamine--N-acetylmuramyl-(pentapeptide) pyrophosphoryl-undecaprenol N-acetylglucosamine transferase 1 [Frankliniella fusca]